MGSHDPGHVWAVVDLTQIFVQDERAIVSVHNPLRLDDCSEPAPDIVLLHCDTPRSAVPTPEHALVVIEVAGRSIALDRQMKGPLYARAGIPEYWVVDIKGERVEVYREPSAAGYRTRLLRLRGERLSPLFAPDLTIEVDAILGPVEIDGESTGEADQASDPA